MAIKQPLLKVLAVSGCVVWAAAGVAVLSAEPPASPRQPTSENAATSPIEFTGEGRDPRLLPGQGSDVAERARFDFGNRGGSGGRDVPNSGEFVAPVVPPSARNARNADRGQGRIDFEEFWFRDNRLGGGGPSAVDFERAAGVRSPGANLASRAAPDGLSQSEPGPSASRPRTLLSDPADLGTSRLAGSPDSGMRRSLDPVLDLGVPSITAGARPSPLDSPMPSLGGLRSDPAEIDSRSSIRSDLLNPLARSSDMLDLTAAPRSVRELIDSPPLTSDRDRASWVLDRDTTRDELNPFTPRPREDYQLSGGDSRLGIAAAGASAARARSLSPFRDQNPRIGPSSLAPALILPTPESVVIPARRTTEAQLPSRRF